MGVFGKRVLSTFAPPARELYQVPGAWYWVPGTRYQVPGFNLAPGARDRGMNMRPFRLNSYQIRAGININFPAPGTRHLVPGTWFLDVPGTGTRYMVAGVRHQVLVAGTWCLGTRYLVSTWYQVPGTGGRIGVHSD